MSYHTQSSKDIWQRHKFMFDTLRVFQISSLYLLFLSTTIHWFETQSIVQCKQHCISRDFIVYLSLLISRKLDFYFKFEELKYPKPMCIICSLDYIYCNSLVHTQPLKVSTTEFIYTIIDW